MGDIELPAEQKIHQIRLRMELVKRGHSEFLSAGLASAPLRYIGSLISAGEFFRVVTESESMILTNAMIRALEGRVLFVQCHVPARVSMPEEFAPDDAPVSLLDLHLLIFPPTMIPHESTNLWTEVCPEDISVPLTFGATSRPAGWPP